MSLQVAVLTFNPFQENTYILFDETRECIIIDPGCYEAHERIELREFIENQALKPVRLLNTHCHLDHVFGNYFVKSIWNLPLEIHRNELPVLEAAPEVSRFYGIPIKEPSPAPERFLEDGAMITFGTSSLEVIFTPGHSPGSVSFFSKKEHLLIAGDVLFRESIGRTDLPGGDFDTLIASIKKRLLPLGDEVKVFPGHGPATTIRYERLFNPFL